jgi:hypothetical protein
MEKEAMGRRDQAFFWPFLFGGFPVVTFGGSFRILRMPAGRKGNSVLFPGKGQAVALSDASCPLVGDSGFGGEFGPPGNRGGDFLEDGAGPAAFHHRGTRTRFEVFPGES